MVLIQVRRKGRAARSLVSSCCREGLEERGMGSCLSPSIDGSANPCECVFVCSAVCGIVAVSAVISPIDQANRPARAGTAAAVVVVGFALSASLFHRCVARSASAVPSVLALPLLPHRPPITSSCEVPPLSTLRNDNHQAQRDRINYWSAVAPTDLAPAAIPMHTLAHTHNHTTQPRETRSTNRPTTNHHDNTRATALQ